MKKIYIILTVFSTAFMITGFVVLQKLGSYSNLYDALSEDKAVAFNYYQNYYFDSSKYSFEISKNYSNMKMKISNSSDKVFVIDLSSFDNKNLELFFNSWTKTNSVDTISILPPKNCNFLEFKFQYNPKYTYSDFKDFDIRSTPDNNLPFECLNKLYDKDTVQKIY